jgi:hypothetical protein
MRDKSIKAKIQEASVEEKIYRQIASNYDNIRHITKEINSLYKKLKSTPTISNEKKWNGEVFKVSKSRVNKYLNKMQEAIAKRESIIASCDHEYEHTGDSYYGDCSIWTCKHCGNVMYKEEFLGENLTKVGFAKMVSNYANDTLLGNRNCTPCRAVYHVLREIYGITDLDVAYDIDDPDSETKINEMIDYAWDQIKVKYHIKEKELEDKTEERKENI